MVPFVALNESLEIIHRVGPERILEHVHALHRPILEWAARAGVEVLSPREESRRGGQVLLALPEPEKVQAALLEQRIVVSARGGGIRVSPHLYSDTGDIDRLLEALRG